MNQDDRLALYEKLYLQEVDRREKISARLNLPWAIFLALMGPISYLIQNVSSFKVVTLQIIFWFLCISACLALGLAFIFLRLSWFGHTDKLMPTANEIETYYQTLQNHYSEYENSARNVEKTFEEFLFTSYKSYASINAINNDRRIYNLHRATVAITTAVFLVFMTYIPFQFISKPLNSIQLTPENVNMTDKQKPPPPPPGPGPRSVKGDVPIPKRQPLEPQPPSTKKNT